MGIRSSKPCTPETKWFNEFEPTLPSLENKTIAVTGCTSGTGFQVAKTCIKKGAKNVLLLNRPSERAEDAEKQLKELVESTKATTNVETIPCDLQDFDSVKAAAEKIKSSFEAIDVLCNNAGVMALDDMATKDGYDIQMQTNHLSHFLLTKELYPLLKRAKELRGEARVVQHSSAARHHPTTPLKSEYFDKNGGKLGGNGNSMFFGGAKWERYHQTKLANAVFTLCLKERFGDSGIKAVAAAPGLAATNLQVTTNKSGGMGVGGMMIMYFSQSAEDGTMPLLRACFDASTNNGDFWEPSLQRNMAGPAIKVEYDKLSSDKDSQAMLWEMSEKACGKFDI